MTGASMPKAEAVELAEQYADIDIAAFPIAIGWDARKRKTSKRPLTYHGFQDASTDPEVLRVLFDTAASRLRTGEVWGVGLWPGGGPKLKVVVDIDVTDTVDGQAVWADLQRQQSEVTDAPQVVTASGQTHIWFDAGGVDYGLAHDLGDGIDVRGANGYVVAPGTYTPWGSWEWDGLGLLDDGVLAPVVPSWVASFLKAPGGGSGGYQMLDVEVRAALHPAHRAALEALEASAGTAPTRRPRSAETAPGSSS